MRSWHDLSTRIRVGITLAEGELAELDRFARAHNDIGSWLLLRVGEEPEALAELVIKELHDVPDEAIINGACELLDGLAHHAWHVLSRLAENRPAAIPAIENAMAMWPPSARPWRTSWLRDAEQGRAHPFHRLARNVGFSRESISAARVSALTPVFTNLRELDLPGTTFDDHAFRALIRTPALAQLQTLSLERTKIDDARCALLSREGQLGSLSTLILWANAITHRGLVQLLTSPRLPRLERIDAGGCAVDLVEFADALAKAPLAEATRAVRLDLSQCTRASAGLEALAKTPAMQRIGGLALHHVDLDVEAARALASSLHASALRSLSINKQSLGAEGIRQLLEAPWLGRLHSLVLFNQRPGDGISNAWRKLSGGDLQCLELMHGELGFASAQALGEADLSKLRVLRLSHNPLGDEGVAAILSNSTLTALETFEASNCDAGLQTARVLSRAQHLGALRVLTLGDSFPRTAAVALADASLPSLRRLQLIGADSDAISELSERSAFARCFVTSSMFTSWKSLVQ